VLAKVVLGRLDYPRESVVRYDLRVVRIGEHVWHKRSADVPGSTALFEIVHDLQVGNRLLRPD
jgi:hypothetical protein